MPSHRNLKTLLLRIRPEIGALCLVLLIEPTRLDAQSSPASGYTDLKIHAVGNVLRVVANGALSSSTYQGPVCQYPREGGIENMIAGYPVLELSAAVSDHDSLRYLYSQWWDPGVEPWDSIWVVRDFATADIPFWHAYSGLSDEDFVYRCSNERPHTVELACSGSSPPVTLSLPPLYVGMHVSNITWSYPPLDDVILTRYRIFPLRSGLTDIFVSVYFRGGIGPSTVSWRESDDISVYSPDSHLAVVTDGGLVDGIQSRNAVGYRIFPPPTSSPAQLRWTTRDDFSRQEALKCVQSPDEYATVMHNLLSSNVQLSGRVQGSNWIAVGPFSAAPGDTLEIWTAEILGQSTGDVMNKSALLDFLSQRGFLTPRPPPAPPLRVERAKKSLRLRWDALAGQINPETYHDPGRWDRMDVPFEGYRLYRSTRSLDGPWTLLMEYDIPANGFARDLGLQHDYTETGLLDHAEYYYAVTAFSKPDTVTGLPSRESRLDNAKCAATPGEPARAHVGEVAVVPNPYRSDVAYTAYDPPWERPSGGWPSWTESDRRIQFINLPRNCTISIYTLNGDLVELLRHQDPSLSSHSWNLTSYVGQAVASGIYLFTVEDRESGEVQVGKFVIIR